MSAPSPGPGGQVGFIGLGDMGGRMALRLRASDWPLVVYDQRAASTAAAREAGASVAPSVAAVARDASVICICVVDGPQLRSVVDEAEEALGPGKIVVVHSSVAPQVVREVDAIVRATGATLVDAPVSGSRPAADAGTLTIFAGGSAPDLAAIDAPLRCYAERILAVGTVGAGQAVKIANNVMLHMNHLIALEALRFARAEGLDESAIIEAVNVSTGRSWVTETWGLIDDMIFDHPQAGTAVLHSMMSKEIWQAVALSRDSLTAMPITAVGSQVSKSYFEEREAELRERRR
jgi:3-hydroxyisobutyrate dehydrogenase